MSHQPVLYQEVLKWLEPHSGGCYVDATVGAGGHAYGILEASSPDGKLLGLDVDPQALELASKKLANFSGRFWLVCSSYIHLKEEINALNWRAVDGIILDLGLSSMQLDTAERGFSFRFSAPLDMRFDPAAKMTAADVVNSYTEQELARVIREYGEEPRARQIARVIVANRPINTTTELAEIIMSVIKRTKKGIHPATRVFQALRIEVNQELENVKNVLPQALDSLKIGSRLAVISFHSLEDRIVKQYFKRESKDCICPPEQPVCTCGHKARVRILTRHPIVPLQAEINENPRARSAKLRVVERIA